jgi:glycosyltransferase involved in cell wall biosynthesis
MRDLAEIIKKKGRSFFQITMKHYENLKPFLFWARSGSGYYYKTIFIRIVFKLFYFMEPGELYDKDFKQGVNLIGYPLADIGEGEFVRQTAKSLARVGVDFGVYNSESQLGQNDRRLISSIRLNNSYLVNIFHLKPDQIEASIIRHGNSLVLGHFNIGYWAWELGKYPNVWLDSLKYFHEIWCPSRFIQSALTNNSLKPVLYMPPAFDLEKPEGFDRCYFNLPKNRFIFLFVFDFKSYFFRKNPLGCIQAFQNAFSDGTGSPRLVIKSMDGEQYPDEFELLNKAVQKDSRIININNTFTFDEVVGLMSVCDAFVSLHRSEGIGLSIAQSMLLGKPVIVTNYSGNTDFTISENSCLVDYNLVEVKKEEYPHSKNQVWADPNLDQAASYMKRLVEDDTYRNTIAKAGYSYIKANHNSEIVGENYRSRLIELGLLDD